jgi:hypothetical protein
MILPAILSKISVKAIGAALAVIVVLGFVYDYQRTKMKNLELQQKVGVYEETLLQTEKTIKKLQELEIKQQKDIRDDENRIRQRTYFDSH